MSVAKASIRLHCSQGTSNKDYVIEKIDGNLVARYGRTGTALANRNDLGQYTTSALIKVVKSKLSKGYNLVEVNGKPLPSGDLGAAVRIFDGESWDAQPTAQPTSRLKAKNVHVTFDEGQIAPIW